jgi:hypothetical protein
MNPKIVKAWNTKSGLPALILQMPMGFHCGYVGVPSDHPAYGKEYDDAMLGSIDVHGGLTYAGTVPQKPQSPFWAFGYDCAHSGDAHSALEETDRNVWRDQAYCHTECEQLAHDLKALSEDTHAPQT